MARRDTPKPRTHATRVGAVLPEADRDRFDALLEQAIEQLPGQIRALLEVTPVIVEDSPSDQLLKELGMTDPTELCGLHTGVALTERSVEQGHALPEEIRLFRAGIINLAGGWGQRHADDKIYEEIWITLLHEIGHHFGLDEDDLESLGYA